MREGATRAETRSESAERTRQLILETAYACFQAGGYHATALSDILSRAGLTRGALFHHFTSKKALGLAVIEGEVTTRIRTTWVAPVEAAPTAFAGLRECLRRVLDDSDQDGWRGCPLNNLSHELSAADPDFRVVINGVFRTWIGALAAKLRQDVHRGRIRSDVAVDAVATTLVGSIEGALSLAKAEQGPELFRRICGQLDIYMSTMELVDSAQGAPAG